MTISMDKDELRQYNRRPGLPKPGRVHGSGGKLRGRKDDKYIDTRSSVNKLNPAIRGQTNIVQGRVYHEHESDVYLDGKPVQFAYQVNSIGIGEPFRPKNRKPLRRR